MKSDNLKVAIVHDWFDQIDGGSERVAVHIAKLFPEADIFTMLYNEEKFDKYLSKRNIRTSFLQKLPIFIRKNHHLLLPLIPIALKRMDFSEYDLVISSSPAFSKNINTSNKTTHITYCHSPMRFAWDYWPKYLDERELSPLRRAVAKIIIPMIRKWDLKGASGVDHWIANSETVKNRISQYYDIDKVTVINPPVKTSDAPKSNIHKKDFYITLATLASYKRIDLAIMACNLARAKLIVIGDGPQRAELEQIAGDTISFTGFIDTNEKWKFIAEAKALIFPTEEDFGIAPIESLAAGTPVIGYNKGGLTETITDGVTGFMFNQQASESIVVAMEKLESANLNPVNMINQAAKYDSKFFDERFLDFVKKATENA